MGKRVVTSTEPTGQALFPEVLGRVRTMVVCVALAATGCAGDGSNASEATPSASLDASTATPSTSAGVTSGGAPSASAPATPVAPGNPRPPAVTPGVSTAVAPGMPTRPPGTPTGATEDVATDDSSPTTPSDQLSTADEDVTSSDASSTSDASTMPEPPVNLPAGVTGMFPLPGATGVCPDPTLHLWFASKPSLGAKGKVSVYDAASPNTPVATVDLAQGNPSDNLGGSTFKLSKRAFVDANEVIVTLPAAGLGYGKTYFVKVDSGVVTGPSGPFTVDDEQTWRFSTIGAPPSNTDTLRVALDDSAQFCTLQAAIDAARDDTTISVGPGNYYGLVYFKNKRGLTISGDDRETTAFKGINNNTLNPSTRGRALIGSESVTGLTIENVTIHNLTPQDGSQAEALALLSCDQCVVRNSSILSLQDTLLWSGRIYAEDCYIAGNVDYIWGTGTVYFNRCEVHTTGRKGYNVQARNGANAHGYVFVDSKLTSDPGITGDVLARIDVAEYPSSEVAYIDCEMGAHISAAGWLISGGGAPQSLRFLEYRSRTPSGDLVDTSQRLTGSRQLSQNEAATYRDPAAILGGWSPPVTQ